VLADGYKRPIVAAAANALLTLVSVLGSFTSTEAAREHCAGAICNIAVGGAYSYYTFILVSPVCRDGHNLRRCPLCSFVLQCVRSSARGCCLRVWINLRPLCAEAFRGPIVDASALPTLVLMLGAAASSEATKANCADAILVIARSGASCFRCLLTRKLHCNKIASSLPLLIRCNRHGKRIYICTDFGLLCTDEYRAAVVASSALPALASVLGSSTSEATREKCAGAIANLAYGGALQHRRSIGYHAVVCAHGDGEHLCLCTDTGFLPSDDRGAVVDTGALKALVLVLATSTSEATRANCAKALSRMSHDGALRCGSALVQLLFCYMCASCAGARVVRKVVRHNRCATAPRANWCLLCLATHLAAPAHRDV
jgi:Armadillo/beta-catenin-like repeat